MTYEPKKTTKRILEFAKEIDMKDKDLAYELGVPGSNITSMKKGLSNVTSTKLLEFLAEHRELNTDWILYGEGEMFTKHSKNTMRVDEDGGIVFSSELASSDVARLEVKSLKDLLKERERYIQSLLELLQLYKNTK